MNRSIGVVGTVLCAAALLAGCGDRTSSVAPTVTVTAGASATVGAQAAGTQPPGAREPGTGAPSGGTTVTATAAAPTPLPVAGAGVTRVITESGKTTCNVYAEYLDCQSPDFGRTYRTPDGQPATGFRYSVSGLEWHYGNMSVATPATTLRYGHTYTASGWTIAASEGKTVFTRGTRGVSVDVANTTTF
ncbi:MULTISPECIES: hypothetical protein [Tsukamurella]|uniref:Lipoprotein LpqJ n=2 Tax=Tsukamurella TaxID=2060 RepID=A0A5C5RZJ0_9ACTN|nr:MULTISPECIES: hypothetical protein [Tsukamurella]NMD56019.1 hypothetical protein [Tsukamurella columbiensis]TWS27913.1 hypothetical protein FK530_16000 [Tsukamurella conjunctivitidis]